MEEAALDIVFSSRHLLQTACTSEPLSTGTQTAYIVASIVLIAFSGLCSGLTLGLLSLDKLDLEVIKRSGNPKQQKLASRVEPLVENPHLVLVTLVLFNAIAATALPIFIDRLLNPIAAIAISVSAILVFGEIAPQALCKRYGLQVGAYLTWLVRILMVIGFPVAWPIGKLLDYLLGHESVLFRRSELRALVSVHGDRQHSNRGDTLLTQDEVQVIQGALDLAGKTAEMCMTPLENVFSLSTTDVINRELLERVIERGHSRIPVYKGPNKGNIIGLILVKELVLVDETSGFRVDQCALRDLPRLRADIPVYSAMKMFRSGHSHMAVLTRPAPVLDAHPGVPNGGEREEESVRSVADSVGAAGAGGPLSEEQQKKRQEEVVVGILTIEDVLEELLQTEILDETDKFVDNLQTVARRLHGRPVGIRKFLTKKHDTSALNLAGLTGNGGSETTAAAAATTTTVGEPVARQASVASSIFSLGGGRASPEKGHQLVEVKVDKVPPPPQGGLASPFPVTAVAPVSGVDGSSHSSASANVNIPGTGNGNGSTGIGGAFGRWFKSPPPSPPSTVLKQRRQSVEMPKDKEGGK